MPVEFERKYLVVGEGWRGIAEGGRRILQGYLAMSPTHHVRIRRTDDAAYLTVKSRRAARGRFEYEYLIPLHHADELLSQLSLGKVIDKVRFEVPLDQHVVQIDEFAGSNVGLVLAEIELRDVDDQGPSFLPSWLGDEVTDDDRFYNSYLAEHPFDGWE